MTDFSPEPFDLRNLAAQLPDREALDLVDSGGGVRGPEIPSRFEAGGDDPDQSLHP
jgi:hypothetical protein